MFIILIYRVMIGQHISHIASFIRSYKAENVDTRLSLARHFTGEDELSYLQTAINQWIESQEIQLKKEQQANIKLNRANEELSQFSHSASHDLKAPLTSIVGFLRFAKQDTQQGDNEKALYGIERAMEEAERLSERIEDMLTLAKSELANNEWETVDIASLISNSHSEQEAGSANEPSMERSNFRACGAKTGSNSATNECLDRIGLF